MCRGHTGLEEGTPGLTLNPMLLPPHSACCTSGTRWVSGTHSSQSCLAAAFAQALPRETALLPPAGPAACTRLCGSPLADNSPLRRAAFLNHLCTPLKHRLPRASLEHSRHSPDRSAGNRGAQGAPEPLAYQYNLPKRDTASNPGQRSSKCGPKAGHTSIPRALPRPPEWASLGWGPARYQGLWGLQGGPLPSRRKGDKVPMLFSNVVGDVPGAYLFPSTPAVVLNNFAC